MKLGPQKARWQSLTSAATVMWADIVAVIMVLAWKLEIWNLMF